MGFTNMCIYMIIAS